jgi:hypothetical protein
MNEKKVAEMVNALEYHKPDEDTQKSIEQIRTLGIEYAKAVAAIIPDSREASVWFTHFQQGQQMAIASLVLTAPVQPRNTEFAQAA